MTPKAVWNAQYHKIFVELCFREMLKGNKPGASFDKNEWNNLVVNFEKKTMKAYSMK